jgi:hypothetical protein
MNPVELQRDVRAAIAMAYELSRHEQVQQKMHIAAALADLEFELARIEARLGGPRIDEIAPVSLSPFLAEVSDVVDDAGNVVAAQIGALLGSVRDIQRRLASVVGPFGARTTLGVAVGLGALAMALLVEDRRAKVAVAALGVGAVGMTLLANPRLRRRLRPRRPEALRSFATGR